MIMKNKDPNFIEMHRRQMIELNKDSEFSKKSKEAASKNLIRLNKDPEFAKRRDERLANLWKDEKFIEDRKRQSREVMLKYTPSKRPEVKLKLSESTKRLWKDPKFVEKVLKAFERKPNKLELFFESWLNENFPNEWKYVGSGQLIIAGKCPDFVNINGKKILIELFGDYWHKGENPEDRIKVFNPFGYKTLVIWESELKNLDEVKNRIIQELT